MENFKVISQKLLIMIAFSCATIHAIAGTLADYPEYPYPYATNYDEPLRGQFHFSPQSGWMNDINAPLYYRGLYHIFFQHNPHGLSHAPMHWGHATSPDLLTWTQQPIALEPEVHNIQDLWSGSGWVDTENKSGLKVGDDDPILLYTNTGGVSIAYSTDGAKTFKIYIHTLPDGTLTEKVIDTSNYNAHNSDYYTHSRDPKIQRDEANDRWIMVLWAHDGVHKFVFYESKNLRDWDQMSEFVSNENVYEADVNHPEKNKFFECPDLFKLPVDGNMANQKWVLMSADGKYVIGNFDANDEFISDWATAAPKYQRMEHGNPRFSNRNDSNVGTWYGSLTFNQHQNNKVIQMGWQPGNWGATWTGNASFPVELALKTFPGEGIRITRNPISNISSLRTGTQTWPAQTLTATQNIFSGLSDDAYEIEAEFNMSGTTADEFGFRLGTNPSGTTETNRVVYRRQDSTLQGKSMSPINNVIKIRLLVDRGQLEIFGNDGKMVISDNVNFSMANQGVRFYVSNGQVNIISLKFHRLNKTWANAPAEKTGNSIVFEPSLQLFNQVTERKCVDRDVATGKVQLWSCLRNHNQSWILHGDGTIRNFDKCMELPSGSTANGTKVRVGNCTGSVNQKWTIMSNLQLRNDASSRCLDLEYGNQSNGVQLQVWDCATGSNPHQKWIAPAGTRSGKVKWHDTDKCLEHNTSTGAAVISTCSTTSNQTWQLRADGTLRKGSSSCLTQPAGNTNGLKLTVNTCGTSNYQKWSRIADGKFFNHGSGLCMDLDGGDTTNGRQLQVWGCVYGYNQNWLGPL